MGSLFSDRVEVHHQWDVPLNIALVASPTLVVVSALTLPSATTALLATLVVNMAPMCWHPWANLLSRYNEGDVEFNSALMFPRVSCVGPHGHQIIASAGVRSSAFLFTFTLFREQPQRRWVVHAARRLGVMLFGMQGIDDGWRPDSRTKTLLARGSFSLLRLRV